MTIFTNPEIPVVISELASIIFAFFVNKYFVFNDEVQTKPFWYQLLNFSLGRAFSMIIDLVFTYIMISKWPIFFIKVMGLECINYSNGVWNHLGIHNAVGMNSLISILLIQVIITVFNYFIGKYWAFS
ncbi:GtrA family protein [Fructilactobacillus sp. Tb1]|uniref:GtrA family protein n=1 Tax=Fructilactobacillus sp. Tb1 TaxID=3422304 RepID=UPI003D2D087D